MSICAESDWRLWRTVSVDSYTWTLAAGCLAGSWTSLCALLIVLGTSWNAAQCCPHNRARSHVRPWPIPGINHVWLPVKNVTIINLTKTIHKFINNQYNKKKITIFRNLAFRSYAASLTKTLVSLLWIYLQCVESDDWELLVHNLYLHKDHQVLLSSPLDDESLPIFWNAETGNASFRLGERADSLKFFVAI